MLNHALPRRLPDIGGSGWLLLALAVALGLASANLFSGLPASPAVHGEVLTTLRLPRLAATLIAGAALGLAGALLQAMTRNRLAAPSVLGVTSGAQIGLLLSLLLPAALRPASIVPVFAGGLLAALLTFAVAGGWRASPLRLILAGTATTLLLSALTALLLIINEQHIAGLALWGAGSLFQNGWDGVVRVLPWAVLAGWVALRQVRALTVLALGDEAAASLGLRVDALRRRTLAVATLLSAVAVTLAGPVAFIGLIAPNLVRLAGGAHPGRLLPGSAVAGALLMLLADVLVRQTTPLTGGLPLSVATALIGTSLLLWLIRGQPRLSPPTADAPVAAVRHRRWPLWPLALAVPLVIYAGVTQGSLPLPAGAWTDWWQGASGTGAFLVELRLPRVLAALSAGALLALSGLLLQQVVRNPLAGPEMMGVTQGAGLAALSVALVWPAAPAAAGWLASFAGASAVLAAVLWLNRRSDYEPVKLALSGIAFAGLLAALATLVVVAAKVQAAQALVWLAGSSYGRGRALLPALLPWLLLGLPALWLTRLLGLLMLGDEQAAAIGVPVARLRVGALALSALAAAVAVAAVGPVGFVGLAAPHLATLLVGPRPGARLAATLLCGGVLCGLADVLGRTLLAPLEIPLGLMTAALGAPYLLCLLAYQGRSRA